MKGNVVRLSVRQRGYETVPGSFDYLQVHTDDITGGQMALTLTAGGDKKLINRVSVNQADVLGFSLGDKDYHLAVDALVNQLFGDDHCELAIFVMKPAERARIERALRALSRAEVEVLVGDKEMIAKQGANHFRNRFENGDTSVETFEQFLESCVGKARVRSAAGKTSPAADWLRRAGKGKSKIPG